MLPLHTLPMTHPTLGRSLLLGMSMLTGALRADWVPEQWASAPPGTQTESPVVMAAADVRLDWGEPFTRLTGRFVMRNESANPHLAICIFPLSGLDDWALVPPERMEVRVNGAVVEHDGPIDFEPAFARWTHWNWYRAEVEFAPGDTELGIETDLPLSEGKISYARALHYCVQSGAGWRGPIGRERVVIDLGAPIDPDQILRAEPAGYQIEGNTVIWEYADFEPADERFDVVCEFIHPVIWSTIRDYRSDYAATPSVENGLRLARHLLSIRLGKSNSGFLPRITPEQFALLGPRLTAAADREALNRLFVLDEAQDYYLPVVADSAEHQQAQRLLIEARFRDEWSYLPTVREGERLLLALLDTHPDNARVWRAYLAHYGQFALMSTGATIGEIRIGSAHRDLIIRANQLCPNDPILQLWQQLLEPGLSYDEIVEVRREILDLDLFELQCPEISGTF